MSACLVFGFGWFNFAPYNGHARTCDDIFAAAELISGLKFGTRKSN